MLAAYLGLGLALRLWREAFPIVEGGTAVLVHPFARRFAHPTQQPYRSFFHATRSGRDPQLLAEAELAAAGDVRARQAYRAGRTVHPLLPTGYEDALRAIGHELDGHEAKHVTIVELEQHLMVCGRRRTDGYHESGHDRFEWMLGPEALRAWLDQGYYRRNGGRRAHRAS